MSTASTPTPATRRAAVRPYRAASLRQVLGYRLTQPLRMVKAWGQWLPGMSAAPTPRRPTN